MDESLFWLLAGLAVSGLVAGWLHLRRRADASRKVEAARQLDVEAAAAAERAAEERAAIERGLAAQAAAERLALAQAEVERTEATRVEAEQAAAAAQRERVALAQAEAARVAAARAEAERLAAAEAERRAAAAAETQRLATAEAEKAAAAEREAWGRAEAERVAAAQAEAARMAVAQQEARRAAEADAQRERVAALALAAEQAALAEAERQAAKAAAAPAAPAPRALKSADQTLVLVADDSKVVRIKTGRLLAQHQYRVAYAIDGLDAVQQMQSGQPDLVITDVEMPGMDGFELTRHIRGNPQTARLPVIMITAADDRHREQADLAGVSVLMGKPYAEDALIAHIRQALGQGELSAQALGNTCRGAANALA